MSTQSWLRIVLAAWAVCFAASFFMAARTVPGESSLTAGLSRLGVFGGWQAAAGILAAFAWMLGSRLEKRAPARIASRVPMSVFALLAVVVVALVLWGNPSRPLADSAVPGPVTAPTAPVTPSQ